MAVSATTALGETTSGTTGNGTVMIGVAFPAAGMNRPRDSANATALAATAPENPATKDVQPVRNAVMGPNASRRYTYSPPARGRMAASSADAVAPTNASAPPQIHTARIAGP